MIRRAAPSVNADVEKSINTVQKKIAQFKTLIEKFVNVRNTIVSHSNREVAGLIDIRRNFLYKTDKSTSKEDLLKLSEKYISQSLPNLLERKDFTEIRDNTIELLLELKIALKMPDRIFSRSGNQDEWNSFCEEQRREAKKFFDLINRGLKV